MRSFAKINVFLKIVGFRNNYHEIKSRFILYKGLYDEIDLVSRVSDGLIIDNPFSDNIIFKAYNKIANLGFASELDEYFKDNQVKLIKNIPSGGGLGGGSSNAAAFLHLVNDRLNLNISKEKLIQIAHNIGADVAFFVSRFDAANVSGIGEIVEAFDDDIPNLDIVTSPIFCSTPKVFARYRAEFKGFDIDLANKLCQMKSKEILNSYENIRLNDLLKPCQEIYSNLSVASDEFLSGSGSSKFKLKI
ncbi:MULTISPECIES: 4-(cytidine 5'-diphospho)-2-C-methyl-D-erythritol kinase [Campylobacter]|uniref:4-diphosphocytidyl-2-C-methyl-D-erythritol kinase n=1 Tax=Campylobacter porcelli TaxID=1660073 RepID=A0ABU7M2F1_9BACT|nr:MULTISPECIES: 4-(cytidine 5'-diphospho)-2-C-methyl-D-erythritol kinase [unclassified Campylobacter]MCR8678442.1 4-(cytidine 5'-diphospho)-2-C-methyl-D-erythritol kinase [Campylobacter sp. RM19072]MCR8695794.1 4-(cytidine 5'-diphospho)-2-C-methyl-D-erythritol kinase [Campylobacter sp. RM19073]MEE3704204.1 4-(cytidine 5'-diphospho)-2-C-methyl-D-erythritol kinase [Campylobacter sp. CX2-8023-23]MEE3743851.1 4-(cytidine 5'-diphospho)-2-C-methyl-D-erythritol kinase [Campylobacter sp. CX2-4855-23]